jgi:hypothetical protein
MPVRIFISYSHRDETFLEELKTHLKAVVRGADLELWDDRRLRAADDWHAEIQAALDAADLVLLLVSPDFLASDYIRRHEVLPALLAQRQAGRPVTCLFLRHSLVHRDEAAWVIQADKPGSGLRVRPTDYQGLNSPGEPIADFHGSERDREYTEAVEKLLELAEKLRRDRHGRHAPPHDRWTLNATLARHGDDLIVTYHDAAGTCLGDRDLPWAEAQRLLDAWHAAGESLRQDPAWTDGLGTALLGDDAHARDLLARLTGGSGADRPSRLAVRLRLYIEDPELAALPWQWASVDHRPLLDDDWAFDHRTVPPQPGEPNEAPLTWHLPCQALLLQGVEGGAAGDAQDLAGCLENAWAAAKDLPRPRVVQDLSKAIAEPTPAPFTAYFGATDLSSDPLVLLPAGPGTAAHPIRLDTLANALGHGRSRVLLLSLLADTPPDWDALARALGAHFPLALIQCAPTHQAEALARAASSWCQAVAFDGADPMAAFNRHAVAASRVYAHLDRLEVVRDVDPVDIRLALANLSLNRKEERAAIVTDCRAALHDPKRRALGVVAYGAPGNLVDQFPRQIAWSLGQEVKEAAALQRYRLVMPAGPITVDGLREGFHRGTHTDPVEGLARALEARRPKAPPGQSALLMLYWSWPHRRGLPTDAELDAWMTFCDQGLAKHCPERLRIVGIWPVEIPSSDCPTLKDRVEALLEQRDGTRFWMPELQALDHVRPRHIIELCNHPDANCDPGLLPCLPRRVVAATGGVFEATVERLEEGLREGWHTLDRRLARELGDRDPCR